MLNRHNDIFGLLRLGGHSFNKGHVLELDILNLGANAFLNQTDTLPSGDILGSVQDILSLIMRSDVVSGEEVGCKNANITRVDHTNRCILRYHSSQRILVSSLSIFSNEVRRRRQADL